MLEKLSMSHDSRGSMPKQPKSKGERFNVFGSKKQAAFHVVISELRAELMNSKQHSTNHPCILMWVRGDTVHVTEDSVGQKVLSWSDTYFAQLVTLHVSGSSSASSSSGAAGGGFRPKECKFKVQQRGKTLAKTAALDLAKYCSELGVAREQSVAVPLQPCGTLYFVVSTALASEQQQQEAGAKASQSSRNNSDHHRAVSSNLETQPSASAAVSSATGGGGDRNPSTTSKFTGPAAAAALASALAGVPTAAAASEDGDRPSGRRTSAASRPPAPPALTPADSEGLGFFRRMARAGSKQRLDVSAAGGGGGGGAGSPLQIRHRKSESAQLSSTSVGAPWERLGALSLAPAASVGGSPRVAGSLLGVGGAACSPAARHSGLRSFNSSGGLASMSSAPIMPTTAAAATDGGAVGRNLARCSASASRASSSDTGAGGGGGAAAASASKHAGSVGGDAAGVGGGSGWSAWLRSGLGWGRTSNHSGTSTTGALSQASLPCPTGVPGGGGGGGEVESSAALEAAIAAASEASELRELALDMLHERDAWRGRALGAQDALGRAQTARGSAVREAQRLEVRLRQYQDELGRRTDGSLLQELVEAKVRIAELANENMKLRRQITHMGPLFYGDSGDEGPGGR